MVFCCVAVFGLKFWPHEVRRTSLGVIACNGLETDRRLPWLCVPLKCLVVIVRRIYGFKSQVHQQGLCSAKVLGVDQKVEIVRPSKPGLP